MTEKERVRPERRITRRSFVKGVAVTAVGFTISGGIIPFLGRTAFAGKPVPAEKLVIPGAVKLGEWMKVVAQNKDIEAREIRIGPSMHPEHYDCEVRYVCADYSQTFQFEWSVFDERGEFLGTRTLTRRGRMKPLQLGPFTARAPEGPQRARVKLSQDKGIRLDKIRFFEVAIQKVN